jgi:hypothetical protein
MHSNPDLNLSEETYLVYVLRESGCHGRLTAGRIERIGTDQLNIYDQYGTLFEYLSGNALRTWSVIKANSLPLEDWSVVRPEDVDLIVSYAMQRSDVP